jgi:hypothetical protein
MPTIDADIMRMDQEDMVDEIMTLRQKNAELRLVGSMMANLCFNGKRNDEVPRAYRESMEKLQKQWDAITRQGKK